MIRSDFEVKEAARVGITKFNLMHNDPKYWRMEEVSG
jgi:hypothetical protein